MTIEKAGGNTRDAVQTELQVISKTERLTQLYNMEREITDLKHEMEQYRHKQNAIKNDIKAKEKDKMDLMNLLGGGQETFVPVHVDNGNQDDDDNPSDIPTDDELAAFDLDAAVNADSEEGDTLAEEKTDIDPVKAACRARYKTDEVIARLTTEMNEALQGGNRDAADSLTVRIDERKQAIKAEIEAENAQNNPEWDDSDGGNYKTDAEIEQSVEDDSKATRKRRKAKK